MSKTRKSRNDEPAGSGKPVTDITESASAPVAPSGRERADPIAEAVKTVYEARIAQLSMYANSGRFPPFAVDEIKAKLEEVAKEQDEWEKANGGGD